MTSFVSTFHQLGLTTALDIGGFALDQEDCGVLITSAATDDCKILYANANFVTMTGFAEHEIIGRNCRFLQKDDRDQAALAVIRCAIRDEIPVSVALRNYRKDGSQFWCGLSITPYRNAQGLVTHFISTQTNLDAQKAVQLAQQQLSGHAFESGPPAQTNLHQWLTQLLQSGTEGTLVLLDVDEAARNRTPLGSRERCEAQRTVTRRLFGRFDQSDRILQLSDTSFAMLLATNSQHAISQTCEELQREVQQAVAIENQLPPPSCRFGLAHFPTDATRADTLIDCARLALQQAHSPGRANTQFYTDEIQHQAQHRLALTSALHDAITNNELQVHYQPQVNLATGDITCIEALARWFHPLLGEIAPQCFITLAEEIGLIDSIGTWILDRVGRDLVERRQLGLPNVPVAVNISSVQLRQPQLVAQLAALMRSAHIEQGALIIEITEAALVDDNSVSQRTLLQLQEMTIALVFDDFGTQYSSLNHLKHLRFSKVKIDCAFIRNMVENPADAKIVKTIISMAHTLGLTVVADGVETEAQCSFLRDNLCDDIQGFLFSQPLAAVPLNALLREGTRLPLHLRERTKPRRTLLLVDDEINIVAALKRLLRRDDYLILTAHSGLEGLQILRTNPVDVILSDQRMPGMTGVEFLSIAKKEYPETVRLVLSGYTELQSVTDAVNEGAIYKFLTKPWDDLKLRGHIREAFERKELVDVNQQLARDVYIANMKLAAANRQLEALLGEKQQQISRDANSLQIIREALQQIPLAVIAVDDLDMIAFANDAAVRLLHHHGGLLGSDARDLLPEITTRLPSCQRTAALPPCAIHGQLFQPRTHAMGMQSESRGYLITLTPLATAAPLAPTESAT